MRELGETAQLRVVRQVAAAPLSADFRRQVRSVPHVRSGVLIHRFIWHDQEFLIEIQLPLILEVEDCQGSQHLRNTGDAKHGIRLHQLLRFEVRVAVTARKNQSSILRDCKCRPRYVPLLQ